MGGEHDRKKLGMDGWDCQQSFVNSPLTATHAESWFFGYMFTAVAVNDVLHYASHAVIVARQGRNAVHHLYAREC